MDEQLIKQLMEHISSVKKQDGRGEIPFSLLSVAEDKKSDPKETALKLKENFDFFKVEHDFQEGLLVRWKKGLKNRKYPGYDEPAIVIKTLDKPVYSDETESGSRYFREPLDIILGVIINDDFEIFHYDRRRLEPFKLTT